MKEIGILDWGDRTVEWVLALHSQLGEIPGTLYGFLRQPEVIQKAKKKKVGGGDRDSIPEMCFFKLLSSPVS